MTASIVRLPIRERVAVLTCPTSDEWHVTCSEIGTGEVLKHRTQIAGADVDTSDEVAEGVFRRLAEPVKAHVAAIAAEWGSLSGARR